MTGRDREYGPVRAAATAELKKRSEWVWTADGLGIGVLVYRPVDESAVTFRFNGDLVEAAPGKPRAGTDGGHYADDWVALGRTDGAMTDEGREIVGEMFLCEDYPSPAFDALVRRMDRADSDAVALREEERSRIDREASRMSPGAAAAAAARRWLRAQTVEGYVGVPFGGVYGRGRDAAGNRVYLHRGDAPVPGTVRRWTVVYEGSVWAYEFAEWWARFGPAEVEVDALSSYEIEVMSLEPPVRR